MLTENGLLPSDHSSHDTAAQSASGSAVSPCEGSSFLDAVEDQDGGRWIQCGKSTRFAWFSVADLLTNEKEVFGRLAGHGITVLTTRSRTAFKEQIEACKHYRPALVASQPGFVEGHFVSGDGTVMSPRGSTTKVIVAFAPNPKFTPHGTLDGWQEAVGPVVTDQPLPLFVLTYSFVAPLLRFAPNHLLNPQVELVGEPECGKSTLGAMAASVWAGDPNSDVGGGETWDMTVNALDTRKLAHANSLLVLDEGNLAGVSAKDQLEMIRKTVFKAAATGGRQRYTDTGVVPNVRLALLSTSNVALRDLLKETGAVGGALASRMITIQIPKDHPHGVLTASPAGFPNSRAAMEHLRTAVDGHYGQAGQAFIKRLVREVARDEARLRRMIEKRMDYFLRRASGDVVGSKSARIDKAYAVTYAAGALARRWGVLPKDWGRLLPAIREVRRSSHEVSAVLSSPSAIDRVHGYVEQHRKKLVKVSDVTVPYTRKKFETQAGFKRLTKGHREILIPSQRFQQNFPDYKNLMAELRAEGLAQTERGSQPKLSIKAPAALCTMGRVYCIRLSGPEKRPH